MACYIVNRNAQPTGEHEVHNENCSRLPDLENQVPLGSHDSCGPAVAKANSLYDKVDGCAYCCPNCNTG